MDPSFGQYFIMDHQRTLRRAEVCARLSVEEQAAWGWLDDNTVSVPVHPARRRRGIRLRQACASTLTCVRETGQRLRGSAMRGRA